MRDRPGQHPSQNRNVVRGRRAMGIVVAATALAPLAGRAQTAPSAEAPAGGGLQEIVVTATRHEESLSKVPISVTAMTAEGLEVRGIKDFQEVARFTPGVKIDTTGTNNISIRGIASSGGAGTTGIYIDDTPIQMRALAFNPDDALPKAFDIERVEVLRGPQGTLFGAGSEGGTVRYITAQPSLTKTSLMSRAEVSFSQGGSASYEAGIAGGTPLVDGKFGIRMTAWYRRDGGWIDRINPVTLATEDSKANHDESTMLRVAAVWAPSDAWTITPSIMYQDRQRNDVGNYWPIYSDPGRNKFVSGNPTARSAPDTFYLPALKIEGDLGAVRLISSTSYYHRKNTTGYDGTLYDLGFYQSLLGLPTNQLLLDGTGVHLPPGLETYRSPASVKNGQQNFAQEIRLQSNDPNAKLIWTTGIFYGLNRQSYLEELYDPQLAQFFQILGDTTIEDFFGIGYDPNFPQDSYFLQTRAKDEQLAWFGEGTYAFTDTLKATVGARFSKTKFSFDTLTGGPQLFGPNSTGSGNQKENSFTPKLGLSYQANTNNLYYVTYAKGFRPGGANNPIPYAACADDFQNFGLANGAPQTFDSDTVDSYEVGAKNNFNNRVKIASSVYYIKWKNIQQTVLPPICQISFITNLGEATAKGADVQLDIAVTDNFTAELSAGYTDARFTKNAAFANAVDPTPIAASGDAIVGQGGAPAAPFTASLGLEYHFSAFGKEAFVRADYEHQGSPKWDPPSQDSRTLQYSPRRFPLPATNFVTLRGGATIGGWSIAAFVDNLTNAHTLTGYDLTIDPGPDSAGPLQRAYTFRPRTFGLTVTYRH